MMGAWRCIETRGGRGPLADPIPRQGMGVGARHRGGGGQHGSDHGWGACVRAGADVGGAEARAVELDRNWTGRGIAAKFGLNRIRTDPRNPDLR
jgi:hypothetical protein